MSDAALFRLIRQLLCLNFRLLCFFCTYLLVYLQDPPPLLDLLDASCMSRSVTAFPILAREQARLAL
jgi:hypothetical protein